MPLSHQANSPLSLTPAKQRPQAFKPKEQKTDATSFDSSDSDLSLSDLALSPQSTPPATPTKLPHDAINVLRASLAVYKHMPTAVALPLLCIDQLEELSLLWENIISSAALQNHQKESLQDIFSALEKELNIIRLITEGEDKASCAQVEDIIFAQVKQKCRKLFGLWKLLRDCFWGHLRLLELDRVGMICLIKFKLFTNSFGLLNTLDMELEELVPI